MASMTLRILRDNLIVPYLRVLLPSQSMTAFRKSFWQTTAAADGLGIGAHMFFLQGDEARPQISSLRERVATEEALHALQPPLCLPEAAVTDAHVLLRLKKRGAPLKRFATTSASAATAVRRASGVRRSLGT